MDLQLFNNLLDKVSPYIQKQDTVMRKCIPPIQRLSLTLRFLATGESFRNMEFATRVPACTLSRIIPEIVRVIYEVLKKKMKRYIPSGSGAEAGHTQKSSFRFYARMQFLEEVMPVTPYV
ncbi:hypothetical protein ALC57_02607 [Trachymyrmex cornetzi]|uniref:Nuclease HARBI1 n=1 Tax=Trachymyrmex cornetzi TaxID=471704 RepID=A0A151JNH7_9HYME|nr:hypothetical protein ALC57_02607 [Trachymyrmex cornetzi]